MKTPDNQSRLFKALKSDLVKYDSDAELVDFCAPGDADPGASVNDAFQPTAAGTMTGWLDREGADIIIPTEYWKYYIKKYSTGYSVKQITQFKHLNGDSISYTTEDAPTIVRDFAIPKNRLINISIEGVSTGSGCALSLIDEDDNTISVITTEVETFNYQYRTTANIVQISTFTIVGVTITINYDAITKDISIDNTNDSRYELLLPSNFIEGLDLYWSGYSSGWTYGGLSDYRTASFSIVDLIGKNAKIRIAYSPTELAAGGTTTQVLGATDTSDAYLFNIANSSLVTGYNNANGSIKYDGTYIWIDIDLLAELYPTISEMIATLYYENEFVVLVEKVKSKGKNEGQKIAFYTDSMGHIGLDLSRIKYELGLGKIYNRGVSGSTITGVLSPPNAWVINDEPYKEESIINTLNPGTDVGMPANCDYLDNLVFWDQDRIDYFIPDNSDTVVLWGGINDISQRGTGQVLGGISTPSEYAAVADFTTQLDYLQYALITTIKRIKTRLPYVKILGIGIPYNFEIANNDAKADYFYTANESLRDIYKLFGIPFLDLLAISGIDMFNYTQGTDNTHPITPKFRKKYTDLVVEFLRQNARP